MADPSLHAAVIHQSDTFDASTGSNHVRSRWLLLFPDKGFAGLQLDIHAQPRQATTYSLRCSELVEAAELPGTPPIPDDLQMVGTLLQHTERVTQWVLQFPTLKVFAGLELLKSDNGSARYALRCTSLTNDMEKVLRSLQGDPGSASLKLVCDLLDRTIPK